MKLPFLIFKGTTEVCYGIMRSFSDRLADALLEKGEEVIYLDPKDDFITGYANRQYKAVIAFMDVLFDNVMPGTDKPLFDFFHGPKFNYWPDHPSVFRHQMNHTPGDYHILTEDRNYAKFINKYYDKAHGIFFPPGAMKAVDDIPFEERTYGVSFVGTYKNWKEILGNIVFEDEVGIKLRDTYLDILVSQCDLTTEDAFTKALDKIGAHPQTDVFLTLLNQMHWLADGVVSALYREKVVDTILKSNIDLDVFGDSWKGSPFCDNLHLHIHPASDASDISRIYSDSKISLNVMTWHKDCITERILDAMSAGSIVLTDRTPSLESEFKSREDILYYSLSDLGKIPGLIKDHIGDPDMAQRGRQIVLSKHMWVNRAEELLRIIDSLKA